MNKKILVIIDILTLLSILFGYFFNFVSVAGVIIVLFSITLLMFMFRKNIVRFKFIYDVINLMLIAFSVLALLYMFYNAEFLPLLYIEIFSVILFPVLFTVKVAYDIRDDNCKSDKIYITGSIITSIFVILSVIVFQLYKDTLQMNLEYDTFYTCSRYLFWIILILIIYKKIFIKKSI